MKMSKLISVSCAIALAASAMLQFSAFAADNSLYVGYSDNQSDYSDVPTAVNAAAQPAALNGKFIQTLTPASTEYTWSIDTDIQLGDLLYTDREVTYRALPTALLGGEAINTPCDGKKDDSELARFKAAVNAEVYVLTDSRVTSAPSWLDSYTKTGMTAENSQDVIYNIYRKYAKAGEQLTLGTNGQSTGCTNYTVVVRELKGDANDDADVNADDASKMNHFLLTADGMQNSTSADMNSDGMVNAIDITLIKRRLMNQSAVVIPPEEETTTSESGEQPDNSYEAPDFKFSGKVYYVGDSTVCNYNADTINKQNRCGVGMKLSENYNGVTTNNLALSGRSSRSFLNDNEYKTMTNSIGKGDYLFIQFGHNDEKTDDAERGTYPGLDLSKLDSTGKDSSGKYSFEWYILNKYVKIAQGKGAQPVIVTPVTRRSSNGMPNFSSHTDYANALIALGKQYNIPVIDMTGATTKLYNELYASGGADATAAMHCWKDDAHSAIDNTHLSVKGASTVAQMIAQETKELRLKISEKLK